VWGLTILGSGSKGNSMVLEGREGSLLIDAGFSKRRTLAMMDDCGLDAARVAAVLVSHEHGDHIRGLGPVSRGLKVPVYCNRSTGRYIRDKNIVRDALNVFTVGTPFRIGEFTIEPFSIPHDANDPVGFAIGNGKVKIGIATDLGYASQVVAYHLRACDILVLESNHDVEMLLNSNRPWMVKQRIRGRNGHLSNVDSMALLSRVLDARTRHVVLAHASEECNCYELVKDCGVECLEKIGRSDVCLTVARQNRPTENLQINIP
jgi:phosphoribosyl 1,2-cyclic phosphodiesterase